ncbi:alpha-D-ribose 1-methylphosphonate 5-triphosphate diphosphatase [Chachezhania sediminis]|uniref:alpha-D-ribose 1-methylphosphonate 5-triphosphate diphosphatase n=1 Tax=Chachezhania sediminis TaxID=2599291 RepID=UPI00131C915E|nr:alpha-D-ribose 1-methylphosphonate 5-triphosphate diphosphatase [Chachezhania sediminis]
MTQEMILANARLILADEVRTGAVKIAGEEIVAIDEGTSVPAGAVDCEGDFIAPGLVELHTDNLEQHLHPRPGVDWPHAAAILAHDAELAATGITTVFDAMRVGFNPSSRSDTKAYARGLATELWDLREAGTLRISHFLHLRAEICAETLVDDLNEFGPEDRVGIVSLMDHTPGQRQYADVSKLADYMKRTQGLTGAAFDAYCDQLMEQRDRLGPPHEAHAVACARRFGAVLASHDDSNRAQVEHSAAHGVQVAEFPTTVEAAQVCHENGIPVMMGAPNVIRGGSHSGNVAAAELAHEGLLDILSSDYVPAALLLGAVQLGELWGDMARGLATVTATPAKAVGLQDRGTVEIGKRADLIRFRLHGRTPILGGVWSRGRRAA